MGLIDRLKQNGRELTKEQKVAFVLLVFLGIGGVVFGGMSFGAMIRRPFELQLAAASNAEPYLTLTQKEEKQKEDQKTMDTDSDGLTDYDELYVFRTSPYVLDTDSDGTDDKTEVYAGKNPNCPEGKTCSGASGDVAGANTSAGDLVNAISDTPFGSNLAQYDFQSAADVEAFVKSITIDQIRTALSQAGVPADKLDSITDAELKQLFSQTLSEASQSGELSTLIQKLSPAADASQSTDATPSSP